MPSAEYTAAVKEAFVSAPSDVALLETIEINHPALAETLYLVKNREDLDLALETSDTHTFKAVGFSLTLPQTGENGLQELSLGIDNVDRKITDFVNAVKASKVPVQVKYRPYLSDDLLHPQFNVPLVLYIRTINLTLFQATARASFADLINKRFPSDMYTRERFPSLGE